MRHRTPNPEGWSRTKHTYLKKRIGTSPKSYALYNLADNLCLFQYETSVPYYFNTSNLREHVRRGMREFLGEAKCICAVPRVAKSRGKEKYVYEVQYYRFLDALPTQDIIDKFVELSSTPADESDSEEAMQRAYAREASYKKHKEI